MKLILIVRNPVSRAISDFVHVDSKHAWSKHGVQSKKKRLSVEDVILTENKTSLNTWLKIIKHGAYSNYLNDYWFKYFSRDQFLFLNGDNLANKPWEEIEKVQKFIGVPEIITRRNFKFNDRKGFYCFKIDPNSKGMKCLGKSKGRRHPHVSQKALRLMEDFFKSTNEEYKKITNITL